jgi:hypothetical protein
MKTTKKTTTPDNSAEKHFVTFLSPGTFVNETTSKEIKSWDVKTACKMAHKVVQRYNATPFAFYFSTVRATGSGWNAEKKTVKTSGRYFLGGKVETLEEVQKRNDPKEEILRWNMEHNDMKKIVVNTNSWKTTQALEKDDVVLDWTPKKKKV